jgi:transcriptional regulator with XRE-family HTH domain
MLMATDIFFDMTTADLVRDARRRHGVSQRALARRARTSQAHISKIESGAVSPTVDTLSRLFEVLGERLELAAAPGPRGNQSSEELRFDYETRSGDELLAEAVALSEVATTLAAGAVRD